MCAVCCMRLCRGASLCVFVCVNECGYRGEGCVCDVCGREGVFVLVVEGEKGCEGEAESESLVCVLYVCVCVCVGGMEV